MSTVQGVSKIGKALQTHKLKTIAGLRKGLYRAVLLLQRESQKVVPVDTGVLKASAGSRLEGYGFDTSGVLSYGTDYAIYVHENLEARHKPGKSAKYVEKPLRDNMDLLAEIIKTAIKESTAL